MTDMSQYPACNVTLFRESNQYNVSHCCFGWLEIVSDRILHVMKFLNVYAESKLFWFFFL